MTEIIEMPFDWNDNFSEIAQEDFSMVQQPKTGHWIAVENEEMETVGYYCSECDLPMETEKRTDYCPNCGARMIEPQVENEGKE